MQSWCIYMATFGVVNSISVELEVHCDDSHLSKKIFMEPEG